MFIFGSVGKEFFSKLFELKLNILKIKMSFKVSLFPYFFSLVRRGQTTFLEGGLVVKILVK